MEPLDLSVPADWLPIADEAAAVASCVRDYIESEPLWHPGSIAEREKSLEPDFAALPFEKPVSTVLILPLQGLGQSVDHVLGMTGVLRTEGSGMAMLPLLRAVLSGCAFAFDLVDPTIDGGERMRRAMNVELTSAAEVMRFAGVGSPGYAEWDGRRRAIVAGARSLGFKPVHPEPRKGSDKVPEWYLPPGPAREMDLIRSLLSFIQDESLIDSMYRLLSAATHAQPHALTAMVQATADVHGPDAGYLSAAIGISASQMLLWLLTAGSGMWSVMGRCFDLYGWPRERWDQDALPIIAGWNRLLNG